MLAKAALGNYRECSTEWSHAATLSRLRGMQQRPIEITAPHSIPVPDSARHRSDWLTDCQLDGGCQQASAARMRCQDAASFKTCRLKKLKWRGTRRLSKNYKLKTGCQSRAAGRSEKKEHSGTCCNTHIHTHAHMYAQLTDRTLLLLLLSAADVLACVQMLRHLVLIKLRTLQSALKCSDNQKRNNFCLNKLCWRISPYCTLQLVLLVNAFGYLCKLSVHVATAR